MNLRFIRNVAWLLLVASAGLASAAERVLYEKPSRFGTIVVTDDGDGLRTLRFAKNGPRQSVVKLGDPDYLSLRYTSVALVGLALSKDPRRMLVVGLGGGTLPMFLHKYFPQAEIDVVDIDPDVVYVASEFFGFRPDKQLRVHTADGRQFIEQTREPYDVILLDAFGGDSVPGHLTTLEFLRAVRSAVRSDGVVISNIWASYVNPLYDSMVRTYQEVFTDVYTLNVRDTGNVIVLALPRRQPLRADELAALARNVSRTRGFAFDAGDLGYTFAETREKNQRGSVLLDAGLKAAEGRN